VWAGVLIGLSLDCDRRGREGLSCALGLSALFVRELAAIYCVVSTVTAIAHRRWRLVSQWLPGAAVYAVYYGVHVLRVREHHSPTDIAHATSSD
jgi:hypothetical protein